MRVQELIDYLYKCRMDAEVNISAIDDGFDYPSHIVNVVEVIDKITEETTLYLVHD